MIPPIHAIMAMDLKQGIGFEGRLPWRLPSDLRFFQRMTTDRVIIAGRATAASIGRNLPRRRLIVVSERPLPPFENASCLITPDLNAALHYAGDYGPTPAYIIGGAKLLASALPHIEMLHLTLVLGEYPADTYMPPRWYEGFSVAFSEPVPQQEGDSSPCVRLTLIRQHPPQQQRTP
jgi:dihydrofolate reductase